MLSLVVLLEKIYIKEQKESLVSIPRLSKLPERAKLPKVTH